MNSVIAMDVGGTHTRVALFDHERIVWRASVRTPGRDGPLAMLDTMMSLLAPLQQVDAAVGVAIAGQVAAGTVTAHNEAVLPGWHAFPLQQVLSERVGRPVRVLNDARAAAWGEYRLGAGRGCADFLFVTVSTGVGAGLVLQGRLHLAHNGMDAELGETLASDGRRLEDHASGAALERVAVAEGYADGRALCDAADAGDARAEAGLRRSIGELVRKLADMTVLLGLQRSAIGGGLGLRPGYVERLREELHRLPALYQHEMMRAELAGDAGLHGVAAWLRDTPSA